MCMHYVYNGRRLLPAEAGHAQDRAPALPASCTCHVLRAAQDLPEALLTPCLLPAACSQAIASLEALAVAPGCRELVQTHSRLMQALASTSKDSRSKGWLERHLPAELRQRAQELAAAGGGGSCSHRVPTAVAHLILACAVPGAMHVKPHMATLHADHAGARS